ncbi:RNA polymerase Rpb7 [Cantharellus anzutake]|uniref:RNA polymerase Rpb7 n=1 Tax=Cantharellus anzutake TaxID=1750568 RepID=UPI0019036C6F|nr:RNA polymerase Rpb7 [Cantharellus anzutake]KAF8325430.1 RNA polymerase Rpb7 [Cantharellus anzutake]
MFFIKELTHTIMLHPSYFGPRMVEYLESKLMSDVEGTCSGKFGYIICVLTVTDVGAGIVLPGTGQAEFIARYRAIVFKPFKGEVLEGIVGEVNKMGFFAEVGPLNIFVSNHLIGTDFKFDPNSSPPAWTSADQVIEKNTHVRIKIVGTRVDATEIFAIGTIKEDHLGVID